MTGGVNDPAYDDAIADRIGVADPRSGDGANTERSGARGANGTPRYQELLYESGRFELEPGLSVEVASTEDLEHFAHLHRTGTAPEIRITRVVSRNPREQQEKAR